MKIRPRWVPTLALAFAVAVTVMGAAPPSKTKGKPKKKGEAAAVRLPALNRSVLLFAQQNLGKKVGNGECSTLAQEALDSSGAARTNYQEPNGDYVWGRSVKSIKDALPGDVLQFRDAVFEGSRALGGGGRMSWHYEYPHHTAIIVEVKDGGQSLVVLHQNVGKADVPLEKRQLVQKDTIPFGSLNRDRGRVWIYRPVSLDDVGGLP